MPAPICLPWGLLPGSIHSTPWSLPCSGGCMGCSSQRKLKCWQLEVLHGTDGVWAAASLTGWDGQKEARKPEGEFPGSQVSYETTVQNGPPRTMYDGLSPPIVLATAVFYSPAEKSKVIGIESPKEHSPSCTFRKSSAQ